MKVKFKIRMENDNMDMNENWQEGKKMMLAVVERNSDPGASVSKESLDHLSGPRYLLEGDLVEVLQKDRGLRGSWHPAIVVQVLPGRRVVEYEELVTSDGLEKLRETIHFGDGSKLGSRALRACATGYARKSKERIRPRPPAILSPSRKTWIEGTWVDCFYEDAWWEGILTEDVYNEGDEGLAAPKTTVTVFFPDEKDISEQVVTNLRLTQDWDEKTGTWDQREPRQVFKKKSRDERPRTNHEAKDLADREDQLGSSRSEPLNGTGFTNKYVNATERRTSLRLDHLDEEYSTSEHKMKQDDGAPEVASTNMELSPTKMRQKLKDAGWKVGESILKTGKRRWFYRPPKVERDPDCPNIFSTLSSAMSYHAKMIRKRNGSEADSTISTSAPPVENEETSRSLGDISNQNNGGTDNNMAIVLRSEAPVHDTAANEFHVELSDDDARAYLMEMGWNINKFVRTDGKVRWQYRAPEVNRTPAEVFHSLCRAVEEYNRRIKSSVEGTVGRYTIGLLRTTQVSTNARKNTEDSYNRPNKRIRCCPLEEKETEVAVGEGNDIDPDLADFTPTKQTIVPYLDSTDIDDMGHDDKPRTNSGKKRSARIRPGTEIKLNEVQLEVTIDKARDLLRAAGWTLNEMVRDRKGRSSSDWLYKAPAFGSSQAATYQSLCTAILEYNRRVRRNNEICVEQMPTLRLLKRNGHKLQKTPSKADEIKAPSTKMDETEHKHYSMNGTPMSNANPSPCSSGKQGRRRSIFSAEEADVEREYVSFSSKGNISGNLLARFAAATNTSEDVQSLMKNPFGTLIGDVFEDDRGYLLQLSILDFNKEQMRIFVEGDNLVLKATYCVESTLCESQVSAKYAGALSCRLTLPNDVEHASVTASQLKPGVLHLTLPKATKPHKKIDIPIK